MKKSSAIHILDYDLTCAIGLGLTACRDALLNEKSGLTPNNVDHSPLKTMVGSVSAIDDMSWKGDISDWNSRNNALAKIGLEQGSLATSIDTLVKRFGASRIGIAVGSSTSSIDRIERAYRHLDNNQLTTEFAHKKVLNPHSPGLFLAKVTGITGPNLTISTACSSSGKVFATATRWLNSGLVDAVLVGGVDTLCLSVLHGFDSLQLISEGICRPFDENRDGINLGEAAGFAILVREQDDTSSIGIRLSGYGESSDAHHMSHPHPEGLGAKLALNCALKQANFSYDDVDYINLHGTASAANDLIEGQMIGELFNNTNTRASSTKGWTGHTLGAAGIVEAIFAMQSIEHNFIPASLNLEQLDKRLDFAITKKTIHQPVNHALSNSFGFGGNNCCLAFSSTDK